MMLLSHTVRQYIRAIVKEPRPLFQKSRIIPHSYCSCSFGFPSGHSEGSTLFYGLLLYELVLQNPTYSLKTKRIWTGVTVFTVLNIMLSRLYFGLHSIPQIVIGASQGLVAISVMLCFEQPLDKVFAGLLHGSRKVMLSLVGISAFVAVSNFLVYNYYFDHQIAVYGKITAVNCKYCFDNSLARIRKSTAFAFQYPAVAVTLFWGIYMLNPYYNGCYPDTLESHFSKKGLLRFLVLLEVHLPLLLLRITRIKGMSPWSVSLVAFLTFLLLGLTIGYGMTKQLYSFDLELEGDLKPRPARPPEEQAHYDVEERKSLI